MRIDELELLHWQVSPKYSLGGGVVDVDDARKHTNISVKFVIDMLCELRLSMDTDIGQYDWWYTDKVEHTIEELKKQFK